jgi:hypothetical protein
MIIATAVQTINSAKAEIDSSNLRREIKELESQRNSWKKLVKELSEVIILKQTSHGKLEKSEEEVLKQRLSQIEDVEKPDKSDDIEKLKILLSLKQYDKASALIDQSALLSDDISMESILFLSEMCFVDSSKGRAKSLLKKFETQLSKQPIEWQLRYFVINAALNQDIKLFAKEVAGLKRIPLHEAEEWLASKVDELKESARRRSLASYTQPQ